MKETMRICDSWGCSWAMAANWQKNINIEVSIVFERTKFFVHAKGVVQQRNDRWKNEMDRLEKWKNDRF